MRRLLACVSLVVFMPLHVTGTGNMSLKSSRVFPRDGTEDLVYSRLLDRGMCHFYLEDPDDETHEVFTPGNDRLEMEVCNEWCEKTEDKPGGMCSINAVDEVFDGKIKEACGGMDKVNKPCVQEVIGNEVRKDIVPYLDGETTAWFAFGKCDCSASDVVEFFWEDVVLPILIELGRALCGIMNVLIDVAIEIAIGAISFVPGGQSVAAIARTVRAAKTIAENGLEAGAFFNDYLGSGSGCDGNPAEFKIPDNPGEAFDKLLQAPDSLNGEDMRGLGCKRSKRSDCREVESQPGVDLPDRNNDNDNGNGNGNDNDNDNNNDDDDNDRTTTRDRTSTDAEATTTDRETSTEPTTTEATTTEADTTTEPTPTETNCSGNSRRAEDGTCEVERPECSGNNTPLCQDQDCKGKDDTQKCTTSAMRNCKCLLLGEGSPVYPYDAAQIAEQWRMLVEAGWS